MSAPQIPQESAAPRIPPAVEGLAIASGRPGLASRRAVRVAALVAIVAAAAVLRLHRLDELPPGLFIDQAQYGLDARRIQQGETFPVFVEGPDGLKERGREPLFMFLMAGVFAAIGPSPFSIKLTSALIGIATVPVTYLAAARWLGARAGVLAAFVLAFSSWHVTFSRMGFRAILTPLWVVLVAAALAELARRRTKGAALAFGAILGAGFYTYPAYWAVPLALAVVFAVSCWDRWTRRSLRPPVGGERFDQAHRAARGGELAPASSGRSTRSVRALALHAGAAALVVTAPLLVYAVVHGEDLFARSSEVALFGRGAAKPEAAETSLLDGAQRVLFMLHLRGDTEPRHNRPGAPMMDVVTGLAFLVGLVALARARLPRAVKVGVLALWLLPLLPSAVTIAAPNALRAIGAIPAVCAIAALGLDASTRAIERGAGRRGPLTAAVLLAAALAAAAVASARAYFVEWAAVPALRESFSGDIPRFVEYLESYSRDADVVVCPYVYESPNVRFLALELEQPLLPLDRVDALLRADAARDRVFVCDDAAMNALIRRLYPSATEIGRYAIYTVRTGRILRVPGGALRRALPPAEEAQARHFVARMHASFEERSKAW